MKLFPVERRIQKALVIVLVSCIFFINPAFGGEKEQLEFAFRLVEQTNMSDMFVELAQAFMQPYFENYEDSDVTDLSQPNRLREVFENEVRMGEDELKWMLAGIYARHFTENELREIVNFFDSPAGAAWLHKRLFIQTESEQLGLEWGKMVTERVFQKTKISKD
jgi:hypothetical protein